MPLDVVDLRAFCASPLGHVARRFIGRAMLRFWPDCARQRLLGLGFATPYLSVLGHEARADHRLHAGGPGRGELAFLPGLSASALVEPTLLPLPTASIDRVVLVHALEETESPDDLLEEVSRVLNPGGRMILVAPNRRGPGRGWMRRPSARADPSAAAQLSALMRARRTLARALGRGALCPAAAEAPLVRSAPLWEQARRGPVAALRRRPCHRRDQAVLHGARPARDAAQLRA